MANRKLTELPEISNLNFDSTDLLYIVNSDGEGTSSKITYGNLAGTKINTISTNFIAYDTQNTLNLNFLSGEIQTNITSIAALDSSAAADITKFNLLSGSVDFNTALVQTLCTDVQTLEEVNTSELITDVAIISADLNSLSADVEFLYQPVSDITFLAGVSALNLSKFNTLAGLSALNLSKFNTLAGLSAIDILSGANVTSNNILATTTLGYKSGTGGTVTQSSSKTTDVSLNKINGEIVMHNQALADDATAVFTFNNTTIAATDVVIVNVASVGTAGAYQVTVGAVAANSCSISVLNVSGGPLSEAIKLNFAVIKSVAS